MSALNRAADGPPLVDGGVYRKALPGRGGVATGVIMGTYYDEARGRLVGNLYTFHLGNVPTHVTEGTESLAGWELISAPSISAATRLNSKHKTTLKSKSKKAALAAK